MLGACIAITLPVLTSCCRTTSLPALIYLDFAQNRVGNQGASAALTAMNLPVSSKPALYQHVLTGLKPALILQPYPFLDSLCGAKSCDLSRDCKPRDISCGLDNVVPEGAHRVRTDTYDYR
eukprot:686169-Rhodomonas_salina.1